MNPKDYVLGEGDEARKINEKKTGQKVRFLKKSGGFRGFFLTTRFVTYAQHGDFEKRIQSHACLDPKGRKDCPSCKAGVKRTLKTLVFWYDVDAQEIVVRDVAKSAMASVYEFIDTYGDASLTTLVKVSLGEKGAISLLPVPPKKGETIEAPTGIEIDDDLLSYCMGVRTAEEIETLIAGKTGNNETNADAETADIKRVEPTNGQNPSEHF